MGEPVTDHRCSHGVDDRVGVCADCVDPDDLDDAPLPRYNSYAPKRAPFEPDDAQIASAARSSLSAATDDGDLVATITVKLRRNQAPDVTVSAPLSQSDVLELEQVRTGLWMAARELSPLQWYDPARVQRPITEGWERRRASAEWVKAEAERKAAELEAEKPWLCRWCQADRYATDRGRKSAEARCSMNPDNWFKSGRRTPIGWAPPDKARGLDHHVRHWTYHDIATPEQLDVARKSAVLWRKHCAPRFE